MKAYERFQNRKENYLQDLFGSVPVFGLFEITRKLLYIIPFGQPDQGNHAPNEN